MTNASDAEGARLRARLSHPVIDSDGHSIEFLPAVRDHLVQLAGQPVAAQLDAVLDTSSLVRNLSLAERRALGLFRMTWWGFPTRNTRDRATAMLPRLLHERLPELGIDFAVLYPTYGLASLSLPDEELRRGSAAAFNCHYAEAFAGLGNRLAPAALIPMHTPDEALAELDHAVVELGLRAVLLAGHVQRPIGGPDAPRAARWIDTFGPESPHDYEPVWARCRDLGVVPTFHSSAMGWHSRSSQTSYVFNHIGNFAVAGETTCRSLVLSGVPHRFPELRFAFLEGGVGWACGLYADLIGHFEKRNRAAVEHYNPAHLDRAAFRDLFERYGDARFRSHVDALDASLRPLSDPDENPAGLDEFARSGIEKAEDLRALFDRLHFGCEADDPLTPSAFDAARNPFGARLRAVFSSDIGHWDVPDMSGVLAEAWEAVESGTLSEADFRDFVFGNPVSLWGPAFFRDTAVAGEAEREARGEAKRD